MSLDKHVVGYCRVSTVGQVQEGAGLDIQKTRITEFCKQNDFALDKIYVDEGISGAIRDRPALLELLKDCEGGLIRQLIIYRQDRLSRELGVSLWLETQFLKYDVKMTSVLEPEFDMNDPMGKALRRIISVFGELEKDLITFRLRAGRVNRAKNGERGCGPIPFGYEKVGDSLEINLEEAKWVEKVFRMAAKGCGCSEIARYINKNGVRTKRNKNFSPEGVRYVLKNKLYYGETNFAEVNVKGVHAPIISKRLFVKVQKGCSISPA